MPIYRYRCTECGRERELTLEMSDKIPKEIICLGLEEDNKAQLDCDGTLIRMYDKFHFHISGR